MEGTLRQNIAVTTRKLMPRMLATIVVGSLGTVAGASPEAPVPAIADQPTRFSVLDDFESVKPSWQIGKSSALAGIRSQRRSDVAPRNGRRCEAIWVFGKRGGERILAAHDIPPAAAIDEFSARLWVRGNRPGFQLMARIRLPRANDDDGKSIAFYVYGDRYQAQGGWQELRIERFQQQIVSAVRVLRLKHGRQVDASEAYVDQVLINTYGGAGSNRLWLDDLALSGFVPAAVEPLFSTKGSVRLANYAFGAERREGPHPFRQPPTDWVARAVKHHGESFASLQQLGFNTIWLPAAATRAELDQAGDLGLWLICPPPLLREPLDGYDRVAAWSLEPRSQSEQSMRRIAQFLRTSDPHRRPIIALDALGHRPINEITDILVTASPSAPGMTNTNTNTKSYVARWGTLGDVSVTDSRWYRLRSQVWSGVIAGYSGFVMTSESNLEAPQSQHARNLAELVNQELTILRPWIALAFAERFAARDSRSNLNVFGLRDRHSGIAFVQKSPAYDGQTAVWKDVDISMSTRCDVFRMEPGSLSPVAHTRVPAGTRISLSATKPEGILLLTDRDTIIENASRHLAAIWPRTRELLLDVLQAELLAVDRRLQSSVKDAAERARLRKEVLALHGRIAPLLQQGSNQHVTFRQLDHVLGQLDRVHQRIERLQASRNR